jgi:hypothetical protein
VAKDDVPGGPPVGGAAPVDVPQLSFTALFAVFFAALCAYGWATAWPVKPLATFLVDQAWRIGSLLIAFALVGALIRTPLLPLRWALPLAPFDLVELVRPIASMTVG